MSAEIHRRLENLIRLGRIKSVTPAKPFHTVTVDLGDIVTDELRLFNLRAGADLSHDLPSINEECVVFSPTGELALGIVLVGLNNESFPTPSLNQNIKLRVYEDGAMISYDTANHSLQAILPNGGTAILTATGGITINGNTTINGNLQVNGSTAMTGNNTVGGSQLIQGSSHSTGNFSTEADVNAGSISLKSHKHGGVQSGGSETGASKA